MHQVKLHHLGKDTSSLDQLEDIADQIETTSSRIESEQEGNFEKDDIHQNRSSHLSIGRTPTAEMINLLELASNLETIKRLTKKDLEYIIYCFDYNGHWAPTNKIEVNSYAVNIASYFAQYNAHIPEKHNDVVDYLAKELQQLTKKSTLKNAIIAISYFILHGKQILNPDTKYILESAVKKLIKYNEINLQKLSDDSLVKLSNNRSALLLSMQALSKLSEQQSLPFHNKLINWLKNNVLDISLNQIDMSYQITGDLEFAEKNFVLKHSMTDILKKAKNRNALSKEELEYVISKWHTKRHNYDIKKTATKILKYVVTRQKIFSKDKRFKESLEIALSDVNREIKNNAITIALFLYKSDLLDETLVDPLQKSLQSLSQFKVPFERESIDDRDSYNSAEDDYSDIDFSEEESNEEHKHEPVKLGEEKNLEKLKSEIGQSPINKQYFEESKSQDLNWVSNKLDKIKNYFVTYKKLPSGFCRVKNESIKPISEWDKHDVKEWAKRIKHEKEDNEDVILEKMAVLMRAHQLHSKFLPRNTQMIALLMLAYKQPDAGLFIQAATGEGKSNIIAMFAILLALEGQKVDIVTSQEVLARNGAKANRNLFHMFGLTVSDNQDKNYTKGTKDCYTKDIVYGDIKSYQFDLSRHEYFQLNTRGKRQFNNVIVDEVDSLLLDDSDKSAMISEIMPGFEHLRLLQFAIWQKMQSISPDQNAKEVLKKFISDVLEKKISPSVPCIHIPMHLIEFVNTQIPKWIDNVIEAHENFKIDHQYTVKKNQNNVNDVVPIDFANTGMTQIGMKWNDGLHQFLQIKHQLQITPEIPPSNFVSNLAYIKRYGTNLFGLTGTLGSEKARELLREKYRINFFDLPTFREKNFIEKPGRVLETDRPWAKAIKKTALTEAKEGRVVLVICETIEKANTFYESISKSQIDTTVLKYTESDSSQGMFLNDTLKGNTIIVATTLAGRGTDIKINEQVISNGGMHEILTFSPSSLRVEEQAFGRVARKGEPGSAELILNKNDLGLELYAKYMAQIKVLRNQLENKALEKAEYLTIPIIEMQDELFKKFCELLGEINKKEVTADIKQEHYSAALQLKLKQFDIKAIEERWSIWLNQLTISDRLSKIYNEKLTNNSYIKQFKDFKNEIMCKFDEFKNTILNDYVAGKLIKNPNYYIGKGICLLKQSEKILTTKGVFFTKSLCKQAINYFDKAIQIDDTFAHMAYFYKACAMLQTKEENYKDKAIEMLLKAKDRIKDLLGQSIINNKEIKEIELSELWQQESRDMAVLEVFLKNIESTIVTIKLSQKLVDIKIHEASSETKKSGRSKEKVLKKIGKLDDSETKVDLYFHNLSKQSDITEYYQSINTFESLDEKSKITIKFNSEQLSNPYANKQILMQLLPINRWNLWMKKNIIINDIEKHGLFKDKRFRYKNAKKSINKELKKHNLIRGKAISNQYSMFDSISQILELQGEKININDLAKNCQECGTLKEIEIKLSELSKKTIHIIEFDNKKNILHRFVPSSLDNLLDYNNKNIIHLALYDKHYVPIFRKENIISGKETVILSDSLNYLDIAGAAKSLDEKIVTLAAYVAKKTTKTVKSNTYDEVKQSQHDKKKYKVAESILTTISLNNFTTLEWLDSLQMQNIAEESPIQLSIKISNCEQKILESLKHALSNDMKMSIEKGIFKMRLSFTSLNSVKEILDKIKYVFNNKKSQKNENEYLNHLKLKFIDVSQENAEEIIKKSQSEIELKFRKLTKKQTKTLIGLTHVEHNNAIFKVKGLNFQQSKDLMEKADLKQQDFSITMRPLSESACNFAFSEPENYHYELNGYWQLFDVKEKNAMPWRSALLLAAISIAEFAIGITLTICTGGFGLAIGRGFICEGVNDAIKTITCIYQRKFNWNSYMVQKAISMSLMFFTAGIGAYKAKKIVTAASDVADSIDNVTSQAASVFNSHLSKSIQTSQKFAQIGYIIAKKSSTTFINLASNSLTCIMEDKVKKFVYQRRDEIYSWFSSIFLEKIREAYAIDQFLGNTYYQDLLVSKARNIIQAIRLPFLGIPTVENSNIEEFKIAYVKAINEMKFPNFETILFRKLPNVDKKSIEAICSILIERQILVCRVVDLEKLEQCELTEHKEIISTCREYARFQKGLENIDILKETKVAKELVEVILQQMTANVNRGIKAGSTIIKKVIRNGIKELENELSINDKAAADALNNSTEPSTTENKIVSHGNDNFLSPETAAIETSFTAGSDSSNHLHNDIDTKLALHDTTYESSENFNHLQTEHDQTSISDLSNHGSNFFEMHVDQIIDSLHFESKTTFPLHLAEFAVQLLKHEHERIQRKYHDALMLIYKSQWNFNKKINDVYSMVIDIKILVLQRALKIWILSSSQFLQNYYKTHKNYIEEVAIKELETSMQNLFTLITNKQLTLDELQTQLLLCGYGSKNPHLLKAILDAYQDYFKLKLEKILMMPNNKNLLDGQKKSEELEEFESSLQEQTNPQRNRELVSAAPRMVESVVDGVSTIGNGLGIALADDQNATALAIVQGIGMAGKITSEILSLVKTNKTQKYELNKVAINTTGENHKKFDELLKDLNVTMFEIAQHRTNYKIDSSAYKDDIIDRGILMIEEIAEMINCVASSFPSNFNLELRDKKICDLIDAKIKEQEDIRRLIADFNVLLEKVVTAPLPGLQEAIAAASKSMSEVNSIIAGIVGVSLSVGMPTPIQSIEANTPTLSAQAHVNSKLTMFVSLTPKTLDLRKSIRQLLDKVVKNNLQESKNEIIQLNYEFLNSLHQENRNFSESEVSDIETRITQLDNAIKETLKSKCLIL